MAIRPGVNTDWPASTSNRASGRPTSPLAASTTPLSAVNRLIASVPRTAPVAAMSSPSSASATGATSPLARASDAARRSHTSRAWRAPNCSSTLAAVRHTSMSVASTSRSIAPGSDQQPADLAVRRDGQQRHLALSVVPADLLEIGHRGDARDLFRRHQRARCQFARVRVQIGPGQPRVEPVHAAQVAAVRAGVEIVPDRGGLDYRLDQVGLGADAVHLGQKAHGGRQAAHALARFGLAHDRSRCRFRGRTCVGRPGDYWAVPHGEALAVAGDRQTDTSACVTASGSPRRPRASQASCKVFESSQIRREMPRRLTVELQRR